jgi:cytoskeletal protein CcmA (bactofilin family)
MKENNAFIFLDKETDFTGKIKASNIIVHGKVSGTIHAEQSIRLKSGSYMEGEIFTKEFFPERGSVYDGKLHMINPKQKKALNSAAAKSKDKQSKSSSRSSMSKFFSVLSSWPIW